VPYSTSLHRSWRPLLGPLSLTTLVRLCTLNSINSFHFHPQDVCDDLEYSRIARSFNQQAQSAGVPAITSAGIYPGVSNLMAAEMVDADTDSEAESVSYFYFTAGSGGVGQTILATSYHLCAEPVTVYRSDKKEIWDPATHRAVVDFGQGLKKRETFAYNLPEVSSTHDVLGVPNVDARFGTDPGIWNFAMVALARTFGSRLKDRLLSRRIAALSEPWVRAVDRIVGERVGMRVDVRFKNGRKAAGLYDHTSLSEGVGACTAAFACGMLEGLTQPGVWYPEHREAVADREQLLERAAVGTERFIINKAPFQLSSEPKKLGMGIYVRDFAAQFAFCVCTTLM